MPKSDDLRLEDLFDMEDGNPAIQEITLKPNDHRMIGLGIYDISVPDPDFEITYTPHESGSEIGISFDHLSIPDRPDKYLVVLHVQSWSQKSVTVKISPTPPRNVEEDAPWQ